MGLSKVDLKQKRSQESPFYFSQGLIKEQKRFLFLCQIQLELRQKLGLANKSVKVKFWGGGVTGAAIDEGQRSEGQKVFSK